MKETVVARLSVLLLVTCLYSPAVLGGELISWLPPDTRLILQLAHPGAAESAQVELFGEMMGAVTDSTELLEALPQSWARGGNLVVGQWWHQGTLRQAAILSGKSFDIQRVGGGFVAAAVAPAGLIVGSPLAVADCLKTGGRNHLLAELADSIESRSAEATIGWSWMHGDWTHYASRSSWPGWTLQGTRQGIRSAVLEAYGNGPKIEVRLSATAADVDSARFLGAELKEHLALAGPGGQSPMQAFLDQAVVQTDHEQVFLRLELDGEVLKPLVGSQNARRLFGWDLGGAQREQREKIRELVEMLQLEQGGRVADIGTGRGFLAVRLARVVGETGKVWAVDIRQPALDAIEARTDRDLYPQMTLVLGEEDSPRLPSGELDAAIIINAYHEMPKYREMLNAIRDSLRPGGRLLLLEPYSLETRGQPREKQVEVHNFAPALAEAELQEAGFEIERRIDEFVVPQDADSPGRNGLVLAIKPQ